MAEVKVGPGDAVSQLLQLWAGRAGIKDQTWTTRGEDDVKAIMLRLYNAEIVRELLRNGLTSLMRMPAWKELPEEIQAEAMGIILRTRACIDLQAKRVIDTPAQRA